MLSRSILGDGLCLSYGLLNLPSGCGGISAKGYLEMTKPEANRLLHRIYKKFREGLTIHIMKEAEHFFGCVFFGENIDPHMVLNPDRPWLTRGGFISTIIHEGLHLVSDDFSEEEVCKMERQMMKLLSNRQLENLLKRTVRCFKKGETRR